MAERAPGESLLLPPARRGQVLELRARSKTAAPFRGLLNLAPAKAHVVQGHEAFDAPLETVKVGVVPRVRPDEKAPCALGLATPMSVMVGVGRGARLACSFAVPKP